MNNPGQLIKVYYYTAERREQYTYGRHEKHANQTAILKGYTLAYDAANNITRRNKDQFEYYILNQLLIANLKGKFEISPDEEKQRIGQTLNDYQGANPLEWIVFDLEEVALDYAAGSIGVNLEAPVNGIENCSDAQTHRSPGRCE